MTDLALKVEQNGAASYRAALTREILVTEQLRIKAVLATLLLLAASPTVMHLIFPSSMEQIWRGLPAL